MLARHSRRGYPLDSSRIQGHGQRIDEFPTNYFRQAHVSPSRRSNYDLIYPYGYKTSKFLKFDGQEGDSKEHVRHFLDSMGAFARGDALCLRELSKSLIDRAYTRYANLMPGSAQNFGHLISLFNTKFFYTKVKLSLAKLANIR